MAPSSPPLNVLLLTWDYPPARGGIQVWMYELACRLPDVELVVFAPAAAGDKSFDQKGGVNIRRVAGTRLGPAGWSVRLIVATFVRCVVRRPDLLVCGHAVTAPAALLVKWFLGVPYVVFTYAYEIRRRGHRWWLEEILAGAQRVIAISAFTESALASLGVPAPRIRRLYPGVDHVRFGSRPESTALRAEPDAQILLSVSRLHDLYKGQDTVIRALPLIRSKCPRARYLIAGDGRLRTYLEATARSVGVEEHVVFLGDVSDDTLTQLYRDCDVLVQLSREEISGGGAEGFGIVCLEAAAAGKPAVVGRSGGLPEAVEDGVTGILVDPGDLGDIVEAIVSLLRDRPRAESLGRQGRRRVLQDFTWDVMAQRARQLFAEAAVR
jgi:phosphatidylinositol alpha-1,6-mannosyltransferase